uniref:Phosphatidylinositol 4,5-bisphosphate 5-phosphatase A n=2 Tax=Cacopsylla melanoneura TaxID=428564 RepID=A0A8D8M2R1_9HEMI
MDKLSLYFITWNVATRPPGESVRSLLDLGRFPVDELPDFYFIGLQEVKSQPQNFVLDALLEDPWTKEFKNALAPHDYVKVKTVRLVGILLNVFCLRKHLSFLRNMESGVTRTGLMGLWGNKGATSLRLELYGVNLCVTNAHFAAHDHQLKQRINDYNTVIREQSFMIDKETTKILYHDYIFFIGDLNFRLNNPEVYTQDMITDKIRAGDLNDLLDQDQLVAVMKSGEAFSELNETRPTFQPTFKYQFDSHNYDNKRRCAWTDRILYKVNENNYEDVKLSLEQLKYTSLQDYGTSDHKPVLSEFKIKICPTLFASGCLPPIDPDARLRRDTTPHRMSSASVSFEPVTKWVLDDRNNITVYFGGDYVPNPWDWIGVYPENFASLDDFICYIYLPLPLTPSPSFPSYPDEEGVDIARLSLATNCLDNSNHDNTVNKSTRKQNNTVNKTSSAPNNAQPSRSSAREEVRRNSHEEETTTSHEDEFSALRKQTETHEEASNTNRIDEEQRIESSSGQDERTRNTNSLDKQRLNRVRSADTPEVISTGSVSARLDSLVIPFPDSAIRSPGKYRLIYFTKRSADVLGISNAFLASPGPLDWGRNYSLDW